MPYNMEIGNQGVVGILRSTASKYNPKPVDPRTVLYRADMMNKLSDINVTVNNIRTELLKSDIYPKLALEAKKLYNWVKVHCAINNKYFVILDD